MREIKFRGLRTDGKGWVYGGIAFYNGDKPHIISGLYPVEVIPESVGQYTGLNDKNGKDIYEGDKFSPDIDSEECMAVVRWCDKFSKYVVDSYGYNFHIGEGSQEVYDNEMSICDTIDLGDISSEYLEIIGNIHETP